jgi:biopolymer transport protein ExbD
VRPSIPVDLPESETAFVDERTETTVTLLADGGLLVDGEEVALEDLEPRLRRIHRGSGSDIVFIQADRQVVFERIVEVMDASHASGLRSISFIVERK